MFCCLVGSKGSSKDSLGAGAIAGIAIACVTVIVIAVLVYCCCYKKDGRCHCASR